MTLYTSWRSPPAALALSRDEVHVWRASLDLPAAQVNALQRTLAADELRRAERYAFQKDRERFIVARGLLRTILGRYLDTPPDQLCFHYGPYGKPTLANLPGRDTLDFNLSHARGLALFAITYNRAIGIDIEHIRADLAFEQIAERFFSPRECAELRALPAHMRLEAFFACWTRKEAYIKARGQGLSLALDRFDVSLAPGEPAALLETRGDPQEAARWSLQELLPSPGYAAAVAVEGHGWRLASWQWPQ